MPVDDDEDIRDLAAELDEEPTEGLGAWPDDVDGKPSPMRACPVNTVPRGVEVPE